MNSKTHYNLRNKKSLINFIDKSFKNNAKLLPVRLDLGYKTNFTIAEENRNLNELSYLFDPNLPPHAYLSQNDILSNWNIFLNHLRWNNSSLLKDLIGYAWKIEYGVEKGIHYHIMLLFNGNRVQKDYYYADEVGKLWLEITNHQGVYFNCSANKQSRYGDKSCLRIIHRDDDRTNLYNSINYLTKIDDNENTARTLSQGRVFGKSCC